MTVDLEVHEGARKHFDEEAQSILRSMEHAPPRSAAGMQPFVGSIAHLPSHQIDQAQIIGEIKMTKRDWLGQLQGFEIDTPGGLRSLPEADAARFRQLIDSVARHSCIRSVCGTQYLQNHLMTWIRHMSRDESVAASWVDDLLASLRKDVSEQTVLVPLEGVRIEAPFEFGGVKVTYFTRNQIDAMIPRKPSEPENIAMYREKLKRDYQGQVYVEYKCTAEPQHATDLAFGRTDRIIEILRMFDRSAIDVRAICVLGRKGHVLPFDKHVFTIPGPGKWSLTEGKDYPGVMDFELTRRLVDLVPRTGIGSAGALIQKEKLTDLEQDVLEALSHFSHGVSSPAPQDRLLHAMVSAESLLLRDQSEPVLGKLGQRMALLTAATLTERKQVIHDFNEGYKMRSRFVHHGAKPEDVGRANRLLELCRSTLEVVFQRTRAFHDKAALLDAIDEEAIAPKR